MPTTPLLNSLMMENEISTKTIKYDFVLDTLGYADEPLEQRAYVFCGILKELNIPFKKYYTSSKHRYLRSQPCNRDSNADTSMVLIGSCDENYAQYAIYLFHKKMKIVSILNRIFSL